MKIETQFKVGDTVYWIDRNVDANNHSCPFSALSGLIDSILIDDVGFWYCVGHCRLLEHECYDSLEHAWAIATVKNRSEAEAKRRNGERGEEK